ncbi:hypothetical protein GCM10020258_10830 [Sphingomonas yabuuchiae]
MTPPRGGLRVRTNDSLEERAAARAKAREARAGERSTLMAGRMEARAALRERETLAREAERAARREAEEAAAARDPHAAAAKRHRTSGRKDVVREQRDTRGYATVVDEGRIRELSKRGRRCRGWRRRSGLPPKRSRRFWRRRRNDLPGTDRHSSSPSSLSPGQGEG